MGGVNSQNTAVALLSFLKAACPVILHTFTKECRDFRHLQECPLLLGAYQRFCPDDAVP
jgi:hypothetical protein